MADFKELYDSDISRYAGKAERWSKRFHYYLRKINTTEGFIQKYYRLRYRSLCEKRGIEISHSARIGTGFYVGHPYGININRNAVLGRNVNVHRGVTIGQENRGRRKGCPTIGNSVWIGINATVVGNVTVGDDVLIASNAFVNCDVPSHSVVLGNPCRIIHRDGATDGYINNKV